VPGVDQERFGTWLAGNNAAMEGAMLMAAQRMAVFVDVHQDVVIAGSTHDLLAAPAGDSLRRLVPKDNLAVPVGDIGAVGQQVQQPRRVKLGHKRLGVALRVALHDAAFWRMFVGIRPP